MTWEIDYLHLVADITAGGEIKESRNGRTRSLFGRTLKIDTSKHFPLLQSRKMYIRGIVGEMQAFLNQPKHIDDFKEYGCNFWGLWADKDGSIKVDYGNLWRNWDGYDQLLGLLRTLKNNPNDKRGGV